MVHDQADELRQLVRQRTITAARGPTVPLLVVYGGKGGVGTTTIAANLAIALARQGRRAVFVDADLDHGGSVVGLPHAQRGTVVDVLAGRRSVHEVLERGPSGIQVLPGAWASTEPNAWSVSALDRFIEELKQLAPHAELVVVDAGSSRGVLARHLCTAAGALLAVTTTDTSAIMECYASVKVLLSSQSTVPLHTLVNRAPTTDSGPATHARIAEACRKFLGLAVLPAGQIPVCEGGADGEPFLIFPARSSAARALDRAADTLWARLQRVAVDTRRPPTAA